MAKAAVNGKKAGNSLRWRLVRTVGIASLLVWMATTVVAYQKAQHEAEELLDGDLSQSARLLLALIRDNEDHLADLADRLESVRGEDFDVYEPPLEFQIGRGDGTILLRSHDAPDLPILGLPGYSDIIRENAAWRVLNVLAADENYRIQVAHPIAARDQAALEVASQTLYPLVLSVPLLLLLIYASVRRGLKPLDELAGDVGTRTPGNLTPLPGRNVPQEAIPLVTALNSLFERLGIALDNERRFTADAAHELRTPLAALKVHAQVALLSADAAARDHALQQIDVGVGRAGHLVEQLLRLARLDPLAGLDQASSFDLGETVRQEIAKMLEATREDARRLDIDIPERAVRIVGDRDLVGIAIRNLFDNALRYSPADGEIQVSVAEDACAVALSIRDHGPGVPDDQLARLTERFFRGNQQAAEGIGLGLAIVKRITELHGAELHFANHPQGGLVARMVWRKDSTG